MSKEARKGSAFEQECADYAAQRLGDERIERRVKHGNKDRGDIAGLRFHGKRVVAECKCCKKMELAQWVDEAEEERGNDDAEFGIVIHKRKGKGSKHFGENYVTMTYDTFLAMTAGSRWHLCYDADERADGVFMAREAGIDECG